MIIKEMMKKGMEECQEVAEKIRPERGQPQRPRDVNQTIKQGLLYDYTTTGSANQSFDRVAEKYCVAG
ncbi:hypothetical protein [Aeromonas enteropelogenes]|uniref:hypothetical protein n=1 Tax=Aeromonas enteropelogenes TaxID=29489 RepID=UPI0038D10EBB